MWQEWNEHVPYDRGGAVYLPLMHQLSWMIPSLLIHCRLISLSLNTNSTASLCLWMIYHSHKNLDLFNPWISWFQCEAVHRLQAAFPAILRIHEYRSDRGIKGTMKKKNQKIQKISIATFSKRYSINIFPSRRQTCVSNIKAFALKIKIKKEKLTENKASSFAYRSIHGVWPKGQGAQNILHQSLGVTFLIPSYCRHTSRDVQFIVSQGCSFNFR